MNRKTAADFPPEVLKLFDGYVHGGLSRRDFLERAAKYAVGGFTANAMLAALAPNFALADQVKTDDARMATRFPDMRAGAPYYGVQPKAEDAAKIKARLEIHYASEDERVNAGWPAYEKALKDAGVKYQAHIYPGTQHGFHNDTTPRYDDAAAKLSWQRTLALFHSTLA